MKTRICIPLLTLIALFMVSCTSSLQVSNTSSWNDEIYGTSAKPQTTQLATNDASKDIPEKMVNSDLNKLEQKYSDVLEINMDSIKNDTVLYKAEETNPYRRILSDSYEDSYERRLRGLQDPRYGIENWSVYYSDDWFYAQAYDPAFYNVVVMGDQVWVEPWYISSSFGWPRSHFYFGFGWNYSYWNNYYSWNCGWNYPYGHYYPYAYNPWYNNSYWWGWNDGYWHGNNNNDPGNYYYGRRTSSYTDYSVTRRGSTGNIQTTENSTVITGRRGGSNENTSNAIVSTRRTQTRVTPTYESTSRREGTSTDQTVTTRRGGGTRNDGSVIRTERPTREIGITEPTRRTYNPTYERPRTTSGGEYTRRTDRSSNNENSITRQPSTTNRTSTTPTYNRPNRVNTPSSTSGGNDTYRTRSSENRSSGSSNSSYSPSRSSSSSSSSGSSRSSSSSSSSSGSSSRRR